MVQAGSLHVLEDCSRQQQNMHLDLGTAFAALEQASSHYFEVGLDGLIFPEKIWLLCETNLLSRYMTWATGLDGILINLDEFEKVLRTNPKRLFTTTKLVSFIRQFNLYNFKKQMDVYCDLDGHEKWTRFGLYSHDYLQSGDQSLLQFCARKVMPKKDRIFRNCGQKRSRSEDQEELQRMRKGKRYIGSSQADGMVHVYQCDETGSSSSGYSAMSLPSRPLVRRRRSLPIYAKGKSRSGSFSSASSGDGPFFPTGNKENDAKRKQQLETRRILLLKHWTGEPTGWDDEQEQSKKEKKLSDSLFDKYKWDLDPVAVSELASLSSYGCDEPSSTVQMTTGQLAAWLDQIDKAPYPESLKKKSPFVI